MNRHMIGLALLLGCQPTPQAPQVGPDPRETLSLYLAAIGRKELKVSDNRRVRELEARIRDCERTMDDARQAGNGFVLARTSELVATLKTDLDNAKRNGQ